MNFKPMTEPEEWAFIKERAHVIACEDTQGIVATDGGGTILAVCVADSFTPDSCHVHIAIDNPFVIKHGFLHEICAHLFLACGRSHIFAPVPSNNHRSLKFVRHVGFEEVSRIPDGVGTGTDYVVLRMNKDECRWIKEQREAA